MIRKKKESYAKTKSSSNKMKIPKSFELMGRFYQVKTIPDLVTENDSIGEAKYRVDEIRLQKITEGYPLSEDKYNQCYYHELTHHILFAMGYEFKSVKEEENFVNLFSGLLYQALKSSKY